MHRIREQSHAVVEKRAVGGTYGVPKLEAERENDNETPK